MLSSDRRIIETHKIEELDKGQIYIGRNNGQNFPKFVVIYKLTN